MKKQSYIHQECPGLSIIITTMFVIIVSILVYDYSAEMTSATAKFNCEVLHFSDILING